MWTTFGEGTIQTITGGETGKLSADTERTGRTPVDGRQVFELSKGSWELKEWHVMEEMETWEEGRQRSSA